MLRCTPTSMTVSQTSKAVESPHNPFESIWPLALDRGTPLPLDLSGQKLVPRLLSDYGICWLTRVYADGPLQLSCGIGGRRQRRLQ